jgi:RNA polymerase sigma-70 factor (ECF subfamily)
MVSRKQTVTRCAAEGPQEDPMSGNTTLELQRCLDRLRAGDDAARDELLEAACERLTRLARKMLHADGRLRRWEDTGDVVQNAALRLYRALRDAPPASPREFFRLAALQIRRELIDLARHHYGPEGPAANQQSHRPRAEGDSGAEGGPVPAESAEDPAELERWCVFHREVEALPAEEREVVGLIFYHGWKQADVAELFGVSERTIRRRWEAALVKLHAVLQGEKVGE